MPPRPRPVVDAEFSEQLPIDETLAMPSPPTDAMFVSPGLASMLRHQLQLAEDADLPLLDTFLAENGVLGSAEDLQWLMAVCCRHGESRAHLNLGRLRQHIQHLKDEADTALANSMKLAREVKRAETTAAFTLDQAAELFYQHCYPDVQTCMDIAVEQLQQPRSRIILAALGHYKDELHGVDVTNALEVHDMVPMPTSRATVTPFPMHGQGQSQLILLQRECPICQRPFQPEKDKPKQMYCGQLCGNFAYASLQTWAYNAAAYEGMEGLPWPDPYQHGVPMEQLAPARAWQETEIPKALEQHRIRIRDQRARA